MTTSDAPWLTAEIIDGCKLEQPASRAHKLLRELAATWSEPTRALPSERRMAAAWVVDRGAMNRAALRLVASGHLLRKGYKLYVCRRDLPATTEAPHIDVIVKNYIKPSRFERALKVAARDTATNYRLYAPTTDEELNEMVREILTRGTKGLLLNVSSTHPILRQSIERIVQQNIPCVVLGETSLPFNRVSLDAQACCQQVLSEFAALGHKIAAMLVPADNSTEAKHWKAAWSDAAAALGWPSERAFIVPVDDRELAANRIMPHLLGHAPGVTALFCWRYESAVFLRAGILRTGERIPDSFSIIGFPDGPAMRTGKVPLSAVDEDLEQQLALGISLWQQRQHANRFSIKPAAHATVRLVPRIELRASTGSVYKGRRGIDRFEQTEGRWSVQLPERLQQVLDLRSIAYSNIPKPSSGSWARLHLRRWSNHHLSKKNSWLGDLPLLHIRPGPNLVHGVPFSIVSTRSGEGLAVVMRSVRVRTHRGQSLNSEIAVPVEGKMNRIFFLHACGWTDPGSHFASYWIDFTAGTSVEVPLRCAATTKEGKEVGNIQDWWPTRPILNTPTALPHLITGPNNDPHEYERYLYTLEWKNPYPGRTIRRIRIASNPGIEPTLAVLAITGLKAKSQPGSRRCSE